MSISEKTKQILQEVAILGTGNAVNEVTIDELEKYVGPNGDFSPLVELVNSYMANRAAAEDGTYQLLKIAAHDALALSLSDSEAIDIAAKLDNGEVTWDHLFEQVITNSGDLGKILSNRGEAAQSFLSELASAGKSDYFNGVAVDYAVKNNLQSIGASSISLSNGKSAFATLVDRLKANGIESYVADGYIKNATVFVDANGDGKLSPGEWSGTTDGTGNYLLPSNTASGKIIAFGGTDIMTGKPFQGVLTAPVGSTVINPLTTLAQQLIENGKAKTVESALNMVQKALNLPENTVILHYDPLAVLANANASAADKGVALKVQATALQISNIISQIGSAISTGSNLDKTKAADSVIGALATIVAAGGQVNLNSMDILTNIVKSAAPVNQAGNIIINSAQDLAKITAASNAAAANAKDIVELSKSATVAQDSAVKAIVSGINKGDLSGAINQFTGSNLNSEINKAIPQLLTPVVPIVVTPPDNNGGGGGDVTPPKIKLALNGKMTPSELTQYKDFLIELGQLAIQNKDNPSKFAAAAKEKIKEEILGGDTNIINFFNDFFGVNIKTTFSDLPKEFKSEFKEMTSLLINNNMSVQDISGQFGNISTNNVNSIDFIRLYFSEPVVPGKGGTIRIVDNNNPNIIITDNKNDHAHIDSFHFIHDNNNNPTNTVIISVDNLDHNNHSYHIEFDNGVVTDVAGNNIIAVGSTSPLNVYGL